MKKVFFDESGNTGQNLSDNADPIFVLASCSLQPDEEKDLLAHFQYFKGPEIKFSRVKKTPAGQKAVLDFLASKFLTPKTAAAVIFHKPFMVVTKYCDLVLEPSFRGAGVDFYKRGANIATANLLTTTMPVFLNPITWTNFLSLFVRVVRERTPSLFFEWRKLAELIYAHLENTHSSMADFFAPIILMQNCDDFFNKLGEDELDPIVPAYHVIVNHWGKIIGSLFEVIADDSKVLVKERNRLLAFSDPNLKSVNVGYDRRKVEYPLKVSDIVAVNSTAHRQVQIADIISGAIASAAKARTRGSLKSGTFAYDVMDLCFSKEIIFNGVWPSEEISPKDLGTDIDSGENDVDIASYAAMIMEGHAATKRSPAQ